MENYKIVIADDEAYVMELLAKQLNQANTEFHVVGKAENGKVALELVKELKPDILLTDICMPIMDGLELIREIQKNELSVKTVIISGYDDFSYAKQAMSLGVTDYLLKPFSKEEVFEVLEKIKEDISHQKTLMSNIHQMEVALKDSKRLYIEQFFQKVIEQTVSPDEITKEADKLQILKEAKLYATAILRNYKGTAILENELTELLCMVKENIFPNKLEVHFLPFSEKQIVVIFAGNYNNELMFGKEITAGLSAIRESLAKYYDYQFGCVVGGFHTGMESLAQSYKEALSVWKTMLDFKSEPVFYEEAIKQNREGNESLERPKELEQHLLRAIQLGQEEKAGEILYDILRYYEGMHVNVGEFVSVSLIELVFDISETLQKAGGINPVWEDEDVTGYLKEHFEYGSLMDARQVLQNYIAKCCARFASVNEKQGDRIVFQVKDLIEQNISNESLSLESVSGMLFFSPNYVRQIFKQITGESFMTYLIRRRMETAKELLENETLKIQDIALATGYSNQRYFASCFKKYYGYTPTEFRRMNHGEDVS